MKTKHTLFLNDHWRIDGYRSPSIGPMWRRNRLELRIESVSGTLREFGAVDARANGYQDTAVICNGRGDTPPQEQPPAYILRECQRLLGMRASKTGDAVLADLEQII